jgi:hypothetical protein
MVSMRKGLLQACVYPIPAQVTKKLQEDWGVDNFSGLASVATAKFSTLVQSAPSALWKRAASSLTAGKASHLGGEHASDMHSFMGIVAAARAAAHASEEAEAAKDQHGSEQTVAAHTAGKASSMGAAEEQQQAAAEVPVRDRASHLPLSTSARRHASSLPSGHSSSKSTWAAVCLTYMQAWHSRVCRRCQWCLLITL